MTAYRQEALRCAAAMLPGPRRPRDLRPDAPRAAAILHRDVYGWFVRVSRGIYALRPAGQAAAEAWQAREEADSTAPMPPGTATGPGQ